MKLALLGNYPPKACGIGTFTHSVARALLSNLRATTVGEFAEVIAMEDPREGHTYPAEVTHLIRPAVPEDYTAAADYLNTNDFDLLLLQHEYGIFGGDDGAYLLRLLDRLKIPLVVTLHTVLREPSHGQLTVLKRVMQCAQITTVMTELAAEILETVYGVAREKIHVIEHGVPVIELDDRATLRERLGWSEQRVLFTFGLLGRGKGIETAIRALPEIVRAYPDTLYVVLGKTHPHVLRDNGEEYRQYLEGLAVELGVGDNLRMISKFASEQELFECLHAADIYVVPYPNEAQISSGTLAYAVGAGAAIVSTPFWHATELLREGRGELFPFHDAGALAATVRDLFARPERLAELRRRAADYGRQLAWPRIGQQYLESFGAARVAFSTAARDVRPQLPPLVLDHLLRLTDDCGLLQHAKYTVPNRHEGYCLDDNGRALLLVGMLHHHGLADAATLERLADTYLAYIYHAQNADGSFRNFMSYDRRFLERRGSEDSYGRALWGVGYCLAHPPRPDHRPLLEEIFLRAVGHLDTARSPRTLAYGVVALSYFLKYRPGDEGMLNLLDRLCNRLADHYRDNRREGWNWFEGYLSYSNGILPYAMFRALHHLDKDTIRGVAEDSARFLAEHTIANGLFSPIGCERPFLRNCDRPRFDQQPVDVMTSVLLFAEASLHQRSRPHHADMETAFAWFVGRNEMQLPLYHPATGGCCDGLTATGVNRNQGAESLLAYLISRVTLETLPPPVKLAQTTDSGLALRQMLNGLAPKDRSTVDESSLPTSLTET